MPDRLSSGLGRKCQSCGRQVPRSVSKCRCGTILPAEIDTTVDEAPEPAKRAWPTFVVIALLVGGTAYWTFGRETAVEPSPHSTAAERVAPVELAVPAPAPRELSPEQRAWDAAARMKNAERDQPSSAEPLSAAPLAAAPSDPGVTPALEDMISRAMPAIVLVEATSGRGSAFFVQHDTLITNVHVVQQDGYVTLRRMDGSSVNARVHTRAPAFDIAVLKVTQGSASQPFLAMGTAQSLKAGQEVVVIGSALGTLQNSVSRGVVSGLRTSGGVTLVQSDAAANPGNSGGPMLDRNGRVVGILTAGYKGQQGLNFAVSIDHARDILDGRQTNLGSGQAGLTNIEPLVPGGASSESDRRQQQGEQEFTQRVASAEQAADNLDEYWKRFRSGCYKSPMRGSYDREWFAIFAPGGIPGDAAAGCIEYFQSMSAEMNRFRDYMRQTMQAARRANMLPGTVRDALRAKRLQSDAWDR
jgi:S1-C subfamily serine protease